MNTRARRYRKFTVLLREKTRLKSPPQKSASLAIKILFLYLKNKTIKIFKQSLKNCFWGWEDLSTEKRGRRRWRQPTTRGGSWFSSGGNSPSTASPLSSPSFSGFSLSLALSVILPPPWFLCFRTKLQQLRCVARRATHSYRLRTLVLPLGRVLCFFQWIMYVSPSIFRNVLDADITFYSPLPFLDTKPSPHTYRHLLCCDDCCFCFFPRHQLPAFKHLQAWRCYQKVRLEPLDTSCIHVKSSERSSYNLVHNVLTHRLDVYTENLL